MFFVCLWVLLLLLLFCCCFVLLLLLLFFILLKNRNVQSLSPSETEAEISLKTKKQWI